MYLSLGPRLLPLGIWYSTVWSYWVQAIVNGCVLCLCAFKMHLFAYDWCLTPSLCVHGLFSPTRCILLYFSSAPWPKFESSLQLVGVVFGSLLCTTEASNVQVNLPLFPHWFSSIYCRGEERWTFPRYFRRIPHLKTHNHPQNHGRSRVSQRHRNRDVIIAHWNGRFTIDYFLIFWELNLLLKNWADLFCSRKFALFIWPFSSTRHIHAPLIPFTA